jgi:hypothetical protein
VAHEEAGLADDEQRRVQEQVERARHAAFGGVLDRHHAEVGRAGGGGRRNTSSKLAQGTRTIDEPKKPSAASSLKVPAGPR